MTSPEICPMCSGHKQAGTTTYSLDLRYGLVVVRWVPALICGQCGEEWISHETAQRLEAIVEEARQKKHTLTLISL